MHGPMAMVEPGFPAIAIAPEGPGGDAMTPVVQTLHERGADLLLVGREAGGMARHFLPLPPIPEHLSPLLAIIPMQLLALHLARERELDPDRPEGLTKVTQTI